MSLPVCFPGPSKPFVMGSTLKGKNFLPEKMKMAVVSCEKGSEMQMAELIPLKVYPFTLIFFWKIHVINR